MKVGRGGIGQTIFAVLKEDFLEFLEKSHSYFRLIPISRSLYFHSFSTLSLWMDMSCRMVSRTLGTRLCWLSDHVRNFPRHRHMSEKRGFSLELDVTI